MRVDLHTHSSCSDGTDTPDELIAKAAAAKIDVAALTDHDTLSGWSAAAAAAARHNVGLVRGVELSTKNQGQSQHLLGYEPDPDHPGLQDILGRQRQSRHQRVPAMLAALSEHGIDIDIAAVITHAGAGTVGRPHVADALVDAGVCRDRADAFDHWLAPGTPGYVSRYSPTIEEAISALRAAGGVPVIAHPWGRKTHVSEERFAELTDIGLVGVEVDHQEHDADARDTLRGIARNLGLLVTGSSDHHGAGKVNHDLGCNTTDPAVLEALLDRCGQ